jgi:hypothetical protein
MKFRKRYFLLILVSFLPLYFLIHPEDYCFGDAELLMVGGCVVLFFIVFLAITFYNLYKYSERLELFNFRPLIIAGIYGVFLFLFLTFHDQNFFKNEVKSFEISNNSKIQTELTLFYDGSFEYKTTENDVSCYKKGLYTLKNDSLYLNRNQKNNEKTDFDNIYFLNQKRRILVPNDKKMPIFKQKK